MISFRLSDSPSVRKQSSRSIVLATIGTKYLSELRFAPGVSPPRVGFIATKLLEGYTNFSYCWKAASPGPKITIGAIRETRHLTRFLIYYGQTSSRRLPRRSFLSCPPPRPGFAFGESRPRTSDTPRLRSDPLQSDRTVEKSA